MRVPTAVVFLLVVALSAFALLNWAAIATPMPLTLGFTTVHAPLGLILLMGTGVLTASFVAFVAYQQMAALVEARRFSRDLRAERELADKAEASRFTDLRASLEAEFKAMKESATSAHADTAARLQRLEEDLVTRLTEVGNGLSAHVAEVEDKIDRALKVSAT